MHHVITETVGTEMKVIKMKLIGLLIFILLSGCVSVVEKNYDQEMYRCKASSYSDPIHNLVENTLSKSESKPVSYFAFKYNNFYLGYFLILNYESHSIILKAFEPGYVITKVDSNVGNDLMQEIIGSNYTTLESSYKENNLSHGNCSFIRFNDSQKSYEFELFNSSGEKGSIENRIFISAYNNYSEVADKAFGKSNEFFKFKRPINNNISIPELEKLRKKIIQDVFFELTSFLN